jgi:hypothetical protein
MKNRRNDDEDDVWNDEGTIEREFRAIYTFNQGLLASLCLHYPRDSEDTWL